MSKVRKVDSSKDALAKAKREKRKVKKKNAKASKKAQEEN